MKFVIPGNPIPLKRARHGNGRTYDTQKEDKASFQYQLIHQMMNQQQKRFSPGPLTLTINFFMPIPMSWSQKKKTTKKGQPHISKPDISNLLKFVEDCGTGIIYGDDSQIAVVMCRKIYDNEPRTEFIITEVQL